jgi:hypothetical protein
MAAREYTVRLVNQTGFPLKLRADRQSLDGEWTKRPPDVIQAQQTGEWKSESDGIWTGTWGELRYQVFRSLDDQDKQPPFPDLIFIHWKNPYYGFTRMWGNMEVDIAIPSPDRGEPYKTPFGFEYASNARDMGTYPGPGVSGWLDIIPGTVPLPIPNVAIEHAWSQCRVYELPGRFIRPDTPTPEFLSLPPDVFTYAPVFDGPSEAWVGKWEYREGPINRLVVEIARSSTPLRYAGSTSAFDVAIGGKFSAVGGRLVLNQHGVKETQPIIEKYDGNVVGRTDIGAMVTNSQSPLSQMFGLKSAAKQLTGTIVDRSRTDVVRAISANFISADCLELTGDITLCLYSRTEVHTGSQGYAVRFIQRADSGKIVTDLMLDPKYDIK